MLNQQNHFTTWLPDAMEGQHLLVHYYILQQWLQPVFFYFYVQQLIFRLSFLYSSYHSMFKAIIASFLGLKHFDLKRIIAYSHVVK